MLQNHIVVRRTKAFHPHRIDLEERLQMQIGVIRSMTNQVLHLNKVGVLVTRKYVQLYVTLTQVGVRTFRAVLFLNAIALQAKCDCVINKLLLLRDGVAHVEFSKE